MTTTSALALIAFVVFIYLCLIWIKNNPIFWYDFNELFVCAIGDETSALYERRWIVNDYGSRGVFKYWMYRRITCVPGVNYTKAHSDWFKNWDHEGEPFMKFVRLNESEARRTMAIQWPATLSVRQQLKKLEKASSSKQVSAAG